MRTPPHSCELLAATAASVKIGGRVLTYGRGFGISGATVSITDGSGSVRYARTNRMGEYSFAEVASGETSIINVAHKRYVFAPQVLNVTEDISELDFQAQTVGSSRGM